ncbi:hypothetical protein J6590_067211 [Homalodisca vitripennis]|nr:hypothetical protein J6590_067211 [Homalodisca vitripennis]
MISKEEKVWRIYVLEDLYSKGLVILQISDANVAYLLPFLAYNSRLHLIASRPRLLGKRYEWNVSHGRQNPKNVGDEEAQNELLTLFQHQRHLDYNLYTNVGDVFFIYSDEHDSRFQESSLCVTESDS